MSFWSLLVLILSTFGAAAATFTVTNTKDSGTGSLRQAIADAKTAAGADTIVFSSLFNSARTIQLLSSIEKGLAQIREVFGEGF